MAAATRGAGGKEDLSRPHHQHTERNERASVNRKHPHEAKVEGTEGTVTEESQEKIPRDQADQASQAYRCAATDGAHLHARKATVTIVTRRPEPASKTRIASGEAYITKILTSRVISKRMKQLSGSSST
jgi:hypothetical protein